MAEHTRTLTLTDSQEKDWQHVLELTNQGRPADAQLADVDALIYLRLQELTQGCADSRLGEFTQRAQTALKRATEQELTAVADALKIPVEKPKSDVGNVIADSFKL